MGAAAGACWGGAEGEAANPAEGLTGGIVGIGALSAGEAVGGGLVANTGCALVTAPTNCGWSSPARSKSTHSTAPGICLGRAGPRRVFGEPGLYSRERTRVVNEVAIEETVVLGIHGDQLFDFLICRPPAMLRLLEGLSADSRGSIDDAIGLAYAHVRERVLARLVQLADSHGENAAVGLRIGLRISQSVLGGMVVATRTSTVPSHH